MSDKRKEAEKIVEANRRISRPEEEWSHEERDSARLLGPGLLPEIPDAELHQDKVDPATNDAEAAAKRATDPRRERAGKD